MEIAIPYRDLKESRYHFFAQLQQLDGNWVSIRDTL